MQKIHEFTITRPTGDDKSGNILSLVENFEKFVVRRKHVIKKENDDLKSF